MTPEADLDVQIAMNLRGRRRGLWRHGVRAALAQELDHAHALAARLGRQLGEALQLGSRDPVLVRQAPGGEERRGGEGGHHARRHRGGTKAGGVPGARGCDPAPLVGPAPGCGAGATVPPARIGTAGYHPFMRRAVVVTLLLGACAHGGWVESNSANLKVYTNSRFEHEFMQETLELSHAAYSAFFPQLKLDKIDVVWLTVEPGELTRFYGPNDPLEAGWTLETVPSRGSIGKDGLIVLERKVTNNGLVRDETYARRQMAHYFIMKAAGQAPLWLHVGLAKYLAKYRIHYSGDQWMVCYGGMAFDEPPESQ